MGAELGLSHLLTDRGATPHVVNDGRVPQIYRFLPGADRIGESVEALRRDYDLVAVLDAPTASRMGKVGEALPTDAPVVVVDHHPPTKPFGDAMWTDTRASSVGEMIYSLALAGNWSVSPAAATCLYTAIMTDTGRFTYSNATPTTFRIAAELIELGADHVLVADNVYQQTSPGLMALRGQAMATLALHANGRIAVMRVTRGMFQRAGVDPVDAQEMADLPRSVACVQVGVLLTELPEDNAVKISLRSRGGLNIEPIARAFGGGGHPAAAGCRIHGTLEEAEAILTGRLKELLDSCAAPERKT